MFVPEIPCLSCLCDHCRRVDIALKCLCDCQGIPSRSDARKEGRFAFLRAFRRLHIVSILTGIAPHTSLGISGRMAGLLYTARCMESYHKEDNIWSCTISCVDKSIHRTEHKDRIPCCRFACSCRVGRNVGRAGCMLDILPGDMGPNSDDHTGALLSRLRCSANGAS